MIGSETSRFRFLHSWGKDQGHSMMADHDMSGDKGWMTVQSDISQPFTTLPFHNLKGKFWYMEACQINVSHQNTVLICECLQPLLLTTLQNEKKKKEL